VAELKPGFNSGWSEVVYSIPRQTAVAELKRQQTVGFSDTSCSFLVH